ncbi:winged helix-turn-helix domain-containing protein [Klebsiella quasipneumoniae]|uniref:winged helix-turn-helix domain-containing protein n=2 Tax=Klebsiella quasipneumoniae TaxID=1463165 RepID=UPI0021C31F0C|nr:winged helix-turn-helix domain-containing protein [Klebsiella quasipneumoniae]MDM8041021.1 winged helix-turn-helix domain-containing protein [Klebsiella quasipneumoniae]MDX7606033.1 winged helix-turn-helix domain-containing protein [Klebsiella quasipneumoniae]
MDKTFLIDGRLVFQCRQNTLTSLDRPDLTEILNEPCARCLEALLTAQGKLVSQEELYKSGWGEAYKDVSPNTLYQNILLARKAFRKVTDSNDDFIITVPRQGFRFNEALAVTIGDTPGHSTSAPDESPAELHNRSKENKLIWRRVFPHLRHANLVSALLIFFSVIIFIFSSLNYGTTHHNDFTAEYDYFGLHDGCDIYINKRGQPGLDNELLLKMLPGITSGCKSLPLRYVTPYRNHFSVFYLSCDSKDKADRICNSGYLQLSD